MRKIYLLVSFLCLTVISSWGQLMYEPFNYTPHPTDGLWVQSAAVWQRVNTGDSILVESGNLSYPGLPASTGNKVKFDANGSDYYRLFTAQTSGSVYYSFILNVSALGGLTTTGGYFASLIQGGSTTAFGASVWTRLSTTAGKYNVGVSSRSNSAVSWLATDLDPGTPVFIVATYDIVAGTGNDVSRIWLNTSAIGGTEPAPNATAVAGTDLTAAGVERVLLRQDQASATPFIEIDEIRVGTTWADVTPGGAVPTITISSPLAGFGNVCINTTAGPNSFTISGSNLTAANVTVGALAGYTYSTTSGGTYTNSLSLAQPGGTYTQQIFVRFSPTAVQSYNGNIPVDGGGIAATVNVVAAGSGVNTIPSLTTGGSSGVTTNSATAAGTISATGCTAVTAYGIEYSTVNGFANGSGTQVASTNLSGGNFTSNIGGLSPATTYYYKAYATNAGGTGYGTQQSFTTASLSPSLSASTLTAFGNVCINTTPAPNSFTITGSNLTAANVTVGPLAGYTFSTTSGGTYTASLSLTQAGGSYSQQIFVRFTPTAVQSYNGNIPVGGGGATTINVAASGAGVNTMASVTTGGSSAVTQVSATLAGSITATGCSAVTAYGIEYSTTNGFANGSGTQSASTNLSGGNFTSNVSGLAPSTTYYYKAYATNGGGTAYGTQQSFTTASPVFTLTALTAFGNVCINTTAGPNSFTITGTGLNNTNVVVGPLAGYTFATTSGGTYTASLNLIQPGGAFNQTVFVKFTPTAVQSYNGNIPVSGGGATATNVAASGAGVNTAATVTTGAASNINNNSAVLAGNIGNTGCSATVTAYGIEISGINGFANGTGTQIAASNLAAGNFSATASGLVQGATYYYKAYATTASGTSYGAQQTFTVQPIGDGFMLYPSPVERGTDLRVTMNNLTPGYYGLLFFNAAGQLVYQRNINIQQNFINQSFPIPGSLQMGIYRVQLVNHLKTLDTKTIVIQ